MQVRPAKPYGPKYQDMVEQLARDAKCGIPAMACFHFLCRKIDWSTGALPHQMALRTIADHIGASYRTAYRAMRELREAGIIDYASRGHNFDGGDANIYRFAVPAMMNTPSPSQNDPLPERQGGAYQKGRGAPAREAGLNPHSSLSRGEKAPASRGAAPADASGVCADGEPRLNGVTFTELLAKRGMTYGEARTIWKDWENEALRAAENG